MSLDNNKAVTQSGISSREKDVHDGTKSSPMEGVIVPEVTFKIMDDYVQPPKLASRPLSYYRYVEKTPEEVYDQIEYDMDEEDCAWLELINEQRAKSNLAQVSMDAFEQLMDRFEKESFFQCQSEAKAPNPQTDEDAVCAVCLDGECYTNNVILFCDLCDLAVHQKCYGVPSIPDGSWVCQRCLLSPSKAVECCLCPNRRGAFKQTDDGRWVHVGCALWIPEVDFANVTFLEPVVGINSVAAARWKLVCYICKQRSAGACVQCADPSCYTGFHVTCAQQAGLTMLREHVKDAEQGAPLLKKTTAFCDEHSESFAKKPPGEKDDKNRGSGAGESSAESNNQLALKKARRLLAENRISCLPLFYPVITVSSIAKISRKMSIEQKEAFISRLHCYWTLKRQSRNGMPLLRSRQFGNFHRVVFKNMIQNESTKENFEQKVETKSLLVDGAVASKLKDCHRLRQDLEKVRLLIEQVRKREKLKVEQVKLYEQEVNLRLSPLMLLFSRTLDQIDELVHSLHLGSENMECVKGSVQRSEFLLKMRQRVKNYDYRDLDAFEADLRSLVMESPRDASDRKSKDLEDLKQQGSAIINVLSCELSQVGYDPQTGLHLPNLLSESTSRGTALSAINEKLASSSRSELHENSKTAASTKGATQPSHQTSTTARGRGRGKRKAPDASTDASLNNSNLDGRADAELAESSGSPSKQANNPLGLTEKSTSSAAPSGVNRRTAVLFNNKTRKSAKHCDVSGTNAGATAKDSKPHRRPGRPPKQGGQRSDDGPSSRDRPFMLSSDCVGFGDRDLAERCGKRQNSAENQDFAKMIESGGGKGGMAHGDSVLEAATLGRQSFMQYRGGPQDSKSQKGSGGALAARDGGGEVSSRRSVESVAKESFLQYRNMSTSNSDVEENSDAESSSSSSSSETYCESTSSQGSSSESNADESVDSDQGASRGDALQMQNLQPLDLVWAKCRGYPWYPALIIDPKTSSNDTYENGIPIPVPPNELLSLQKKHPRPMLLVLFFDAKRTWQWLPANKLQRLGDDSARDRAKLTDSKKPNIRRAVQNAYDKAIQHKKLVSTETATSSPQENMDTA